MSRQNQWFVPGDGIAREVITADIQRYLGPDALVRPGPGSGEHEGRSGYWITAYRTLTSEMIQDLKTDSQRWQQEQGREPRGVAYSESNTHAYRQYHGPTQSYGNNRDRETPRVQPGLQYAQSSEHNYTTSPTPGYGTAAYQVAQPPYAAAPRTANPDPYAAYGQQAPRDHTYPAQQQYAQYGQVAHQEQYNTQPPPPQGYAAARVAAPGYYYASDGRQYPIQQQPQPPQPPQPSGGGRRRHA